MSQRVAVSINFLRDCFAGPFRPLVNRVSRNKDQKLFNGLVYEYCSVEFLDFIARNVSTVYVQDV